MRGRGGVVRCAAVEWGIGVEVCTWVAQVGTLVCCADFGSVATYKCCIFLSLARPGNPIPTPPLCCAVLLGRAAMLLCAVPCPAMLCRASRGGV